MIANSFSTCLLCVLPLITPVVTQAQFAYAIDNGAITITGYTGSGGAVTIPSTISSLPVIGIGTKAFYGSAITSVTIPDSITNIGDEAFEDCIFLNTITVNNGNSAYISVGGVLFNQSQTTLIQYPLHKSGTSYVIPDSVTAIGDGAFAASDYLTSIVIPNGVISIGDGAFYFTSISSMSIPNTVTLIGDYAFEECTKLNNITIGSGVTNIGQFAFSACVDLTSVYFEGNAPTVTGGGVFEGCENATIYYLYGSAGWDPPPIGFPPTVLLNPPPPYIWKTNNNAITITSYTGAGGAVSIPSTINGLPVVTLGAGAFSNAFNLTSITIPSSVKTIGDGAFAYCFDLAAVTIPASITSIGDAPFVGCSDLTAISVNSGNPAYISVAGVLLNKSQSKLIQYPIGNTAKNYTIPASVTSIGDYAFNSCVSLTNVKVPDSVTNIEDYVFQGCYNLSGVTLGSGVTRIGADAFSGCNLTGVTIPNKVVSIGDDAFSYCSLSTITIPNSVTNIGFSSFGGNPLAAINVSAGNPAYTAVAGVLFNKNQTMLIQYPAGNTLKSYMIPSTVTNIQDRAFEACYTLTNLAIPFGVRVIGDGAFSFCSGLAAIVIPSSISRIASDTFDHCSLLANVTIPDDITSIGDGAFYSCTSLTNLTIPNGVTNVGEDAFFYCTSLTNIIIGNHVATIGDLAFAGSGLTCVKVPSSVTRIGFRAFANCSELTAVYFQGDAPSADSTAFSGTNPTVFYLPGTTGWNQFLAYTGIAEVLWNPQVHTVGGSFGVRTNRFGFNITGATGLPIVVETSTNLYRNAWIPLFNGTITNGAIYFSDPTWKNNPSRFYRISEP